MSPNPPSPGAEPAGSVPGVPPGGELHLLDTVLDATAALVVALDRDGRIVRFNRACEELTGYTQREVLGKAVWDVLLPSEEIAAVREVFMKLREGELPSRFENDWLTRRGQRRRIAWANTVVKGADGAVEMVFGTGTDVTDRRRTEQALADTEGLLRVERELRGADTRFAILASMAADAILSVDRDRRILSFNRGAEEIFGYAPAEVLGRPVEMLLPEALRRGHEAHVQAFLSSPEQARRMGVRGEIRGLRKSGEEFPAEASIAKLAEDGATTLMVVLRDVTEQRRAAETLREREAAIRELQQVASASSPSFEERAAALLAMGCRRFGLPRGVLSRVRGGRYQVLAVHPAGGEMLAGSVYPLEDTYCSRTLVEAQPVSIASASGTPWAEHPCYRRFHTEAYLGASVAVAESLFGTLAFSGPEPRAREFDEVEREILQLMAAWLGQEIERDRTARAESLLAEAGTALAASLDPAATAEAVVRALVPRLADACALLEETEEGALRVVAASTRWGPPGEEALTAWQEQAALVRAQKGPGEPTTLPAPDGLREAIGRVRPRSAGGPAGGPVGDPPTEGGVHALVPLAARVRSVGVLGLLALDPTLEDQLERPTLLLRLGELVSLALDNAELHRRTVDAVTGRDRMLATVSHDLRTPLTAISMFSHLIKEGLERGKPLERTFGQLDSIERIVGGMDRLIQDLLDVARLEKGELELSPREVSVPDVVEEILEVLGPVAEGKRVSIEAVLADLLPPVRADRDRMLQVLQNLLGNAVAYTPEAGHIRLEADAANGEGCGSR